MKATVLFSLMALTAVSYAEAQEKPKTPPQNPSKAPVVATDTTKKAGAGRPLMPGAKAEPKPYATVITDKAITRKGMITTHKLEDKFFFEIADSTLGRDILVVSRISKAGAEVRSASGYAGDQIGSSVIRFEKGPNNRIFMRKLSFRTYGPDSTAAMYRSLQNSNIQAIAAAFNIAAYTTDKKGSVIDITDYINSDNDIFYFAGPAKGQYKIGSFQADKSYVNSVRSFPKNVEITTTRTYTTAGGVAAPGAPMGGGGGGGTTTMELNTSLVILPKVPMKPRYFDPRVGYFTVGYTDFDANPQGVKELQLVKRWRLEPKAIDMAKYKRGELVEPVKPIVFYIDPATPKKWVPYLMAGINDWQKAFEKAGFKNAIIAKVAPTAAQDSTWSLDDAMHSAIVYKPSEIANASGPSISDPRSGEIIESHINWYHNVMKLVHDWYMVQASAIDPRARKMAFSDELMGDLIRFVSSHEVGHTLGLRHNYGSSSTVPVEMLRNKAFVEANGHTPSIMDYARFNYVAQPEDHISPKGIYPRIGDYDLWAIEWGYKFMPEYKTAAAEVPALNKMTVESAKNKRLWFGTETNPDDPRSQNEDLGDNAMLASTYGIKNLKVIVAKLPDWTKSANEGYEDLETMYGQLVGQFGRYMGHVSKNIGGVTETPKTIEQKGPVYERVSAATQREAMAFLNAQLFTTPTWLLNKATLDNIGKDPVQVVGQMQAVTLYKIMGAGTLGKLISAEATDGESAYKVTDFFADLQAPIFAELKSNTAIDVYRRNLQKTYVERLIALINPAPAAPAMPGALQTRSAGAAPGDIASVAKAQLRELDATVKAAVPNATGMSKYHLQDLAERIDMVLNPRG